MAPAPISFARGAPSPECLDPGWSRGLRQAALERDGTTILSYGTGGGYGPLRELLAERHDVDPGTGLRHDRRPPGLRLLRSRHSCSAGPGRVLVEGPTYDRPLKLLGWQGADVVSLPMDDEGLDLDALTAELDTGGEISFLYTIPTFQNPERSHARHRAQAAAGIDRCRARSRRARGRPVRPRPLRG